MPATKERKRALLTGAAGQDGYYLTRLLSSRGYDVFGLVRAGSGRKGIPADLKTISGDLSDGRSIKEAVAIAKPEEVYNLGGVSDLKTAFNSPEKTNTINYKAVGILLEEVIKVNKDARFLQASSSEVFYPSAIRLNEDSERDWSTKNPYAQAKMMADRDFILASRKNQGVFACSAFLFNHESPKRPPEKGLIRKVTSTLSRVKLGKEGCLQVGNIDMRRDWGFAGDYVEAMWRMLQVDQPEDLVVATGETHSVKEAIDIASRTLNLQLTWQGEGINAHALDGSGKRIVEVAAEFYKVTEKYPKMGDISRAERIIHWRPETSFEQLIKMMVDSDLRGLEA